MPKKKLSQASKMPSMPRRMADDLYEASQLLIDGKPQEARDILEELDRRYPGKAPVLEMLLDACYDLRDILSYEWVCYRLCKLKPDDADLTMAMAGAYIMNFRPALAIQTLEKFLRRWSGHERADEARQTLEDIRKGLRLELGELDLAEAEAFELARMNDEVRFFLEHGLYPQGKLAAEKLLKRYPAFVPALNNLSQIHAAQGENERAIELCRQALEIEPDNIHALSNLTRFLFLGGQPEEAASVAERLKASQAPASDFWSKKVEAFAIMGEDQVVLDLYKQAKAAKELESPETSPLFFHLAAVAHWQTGKEKQARRLWQKALERAPNYDLAQQQLDDLEKPPGERVGVWAFPISIWLTKSLIGELARTVESAARRKQEAGVQAAINQFLDRHPELIFLAPHLLQRGDQATIDFFIKLAGISHHPTLLAALKDFVLGQHGTDDQRMKASQYVNEAGLLPSGTNRMWVQGKWRDVLLLNFQISDEPVPGGYSPKVERLAEEAYYALQDNQPERAQRLLEPVGHAAVAPSLRHDQRIGAASARPRACRSGCAAHWR